LNNGRVPADLFRLALAIIALLVVLLAFLALRWGLL